jgi:hypothetical protein
VAKSSGLGDNLYISGYDLSGDTGSVDTISGGIETLDVTGINKSAFERIGGKRTGTIEWTSFWNTDALAEHDALSALPTADVTVTYCRGTTIGNPAACMVAKQVNYDPTRGADGSLTFKIQALSNGYGLEWGELHTAGIRTDTGSTSPATGVDGGAASAFGLQAYLHVFALTGFDITIKLQESSAVDGGGDAFADVAGGGFTAVAAAGFTPTTQRIATAAGLAVERYLRVVSTVAGGPGSCSFAVVVVRNTVADAVF